MRNAKAHSLNEKAIPVPENVFSELVHGEPADAVRIASEMPLESRARLAAFCYQRRHLNKLALLIASTCDRMALRRAFGTAGDIVFKQSRNVQATIAEQEKENRITLAKAANVVTLRPLPDLDDDAEDEADEA